MNYASDSSWHCLHTTANFNQALHIEMKLAPNGIRNNKRQGKTNILNSA